MLAHSGELIVMVPMALFWVCYRVARGHDPNADARGPRGDLPPWAAPGATAGGSKRP